MHIGTTVSEKNYTRQFMVGLPLLGCMYSVMVMPVAARRVINDYFLLYLTPVLPDYTFLFA